MSEKNVNDVSSYWEILVQMKELLINYRCAI